MSSGNTTALDYKLFCYYYLKLGNVREAAIQAGFPRKVALAKGTELLTKKAVQRYLITLAKPCSYSTANVVKTGLERIAMGSINDVVTLAMSDEPLSALELEGLDLYNVAEFKRPKGGGVEIKFFDRQKALEKLWELEHTVRSESTAESFLSALKTAAGSESGEV